MTARVGRPRLDSAQTGHRCVPSPRALAPRLGFLTASRTTRDHGEPGLASRLRPSPSALGPAHPALSPNAPSPA